jgi:hypothetical protein
MRNVIILIVLLTSLSCNNNYSTLRKLENQSNYLEKEFDYISQQVTDNYNNNLEKWGGTYDKVMLISELVSEIEMLFKKHDKLNKSVYQSIDDFFKISSDEKLEEYFQKINQLEFDQWKNEFKEGQSLTDIEVELLLNKIKLIRNTLTKEYIENVERLYFKFPIISTVVNSESNYLKLGDTYKADVTIAAYDPTIIPLCEIEGVKTVAYDGRFHLEIPCHKKGTFNWKGTLKVPGPQGHDILVFPIEGKYIVK